ncbi:MAG: 50S ribosomal protein L2 [Patescibacteria group bacterium]
MAIKRYKPHTPGRRHASVIHEPGQHSQRPTRSLLEVLKKHSGRNQQGIITVRHRGGGHKRFYRMVDFRRQRFDAPATVRSIEYDPNRTAHIALIEYPDKTKSYIIAPQGLKVNDQVVSSKQKVEIQVGNRMPLEHIPVGLMVHDIELIPGSGSTVVRSAGAGANLMNLEGNFAQLKLPSGELRLFPKTCLATIGTVSNADLKNIRLGKAGRMRWLGIRPTVRGKVMNPVDHPHGGGEGKSPIGLKHPKTPWGKPALGVKTRRHKPSDRLILKRRR